MTEEQYPTSKGVVIFDGPRISGAIVWPGAKYMRSLSNPLKFYKRRVYSQNGKQRVLRSPPVIVYIWGLRFA
jgi:hypothetical protein